jgi:hypothetical protein
LVTCRRLDLGGERGDRRFVGDHLTAESRFTEPRFGVTPAGEAEPSGVADEVTVHREVGARADAIHFVVASVDRDRAAAGARRADRVGALEVPHAILEPEVLERERADGADVGEVALIIRSDRLAREDVDHRLLAARHHHQIGLLRVRIHEAHAPGAEDAALLVEYDVFGDLFALLEFLAREVVAAGRGAVLVGVVLQPAFAGFVADRAIKRMVEQQTFEIAGARACDRGRVGLDDHSFRALGVARGDQSLRPQPLRAGLRDLDLAHAATRDHRQRRMPAVVGDVLLVPEGDLDDRLPGRELDVLAVQFDLGHRTGSSCSSWMSIATLWGMTRSGFTSRRIGSVSVTGE